MRRGKLFWQIYPWFLVVSFSAMLAVAIYASWLVYQFHLEQVIKDLEARANLVKYELEKGKYLSKPDLVDGLCKTLGQERHTRITVILPNGRVIGDSLEDPKKMANHSDRPEIIEALAGRVGKAKRPSPTIGKDMVYVAVPLMDKTGIVGVVRISSFLKSVYQVVLGISYRIFLAGLILAVIGGLLTLVLTRKVIRPLENLKKGAEAFARGQLGHYLAPTGSEEIAGISEAMNKMALQLEERINQITAQQNQQEAILSSMLEGVIAVDSQGEIILLNQSAERMLGISQRQAQGKGIEEMIRNPGLQNLVQKTFLAQKPLKAELAFGYGEDKFIQAQSVIILDERKNCLGVVITLNDITQLKRLENMRKEFVGDVSHELKTPITAIKGFVETLQDGTIKDPQSAERFLSIIKANAERLNAIIEDLLLLSRIEQEEEKGEFKDRKIERFKVQELFNSALEAVSEKANKKGMTIEMEIDDEPDVKVNNQLMAQAIINLLDNAIKYSELGKKIKLKARREGKQVLIIVEDQGWGIGSEHLPRIFERFYRVDKSRSRELGGTGLGLAIVKHIVQAHQGSVSVESEPGKGSKFFIYLPLD